MPFKSEAQRRLMYAVAKGAKAGVSKAVAKRFVAHDSPGGLPEKVGLSSVKRERNQQ